jgi:hypothetical protein
MARLGIITFAGKSGIQYKFNAYSLGTAFKKGLSAVYIITRRWQHESKGPFKHKRIRLGQTDDLRQPLAEEEQSLVKLRANCICVHSEKDQAARLVIQQDLDSVLGSPDSNA